MNKKLLSLALAVSFAAATAGISFAKDIKCEVKSVDGNTVTMDCGKDAGSLDVGSTVKVKPAQRKAIEGC